MSDTIYRQAAIDAVYKCANIFINNLPVMVDKADAYKALAELPSAQPKSCEDAVSKADVLETYADLYDVFEDNKQIIKELHRVYDKLNALPSAQPEPSQIARDIATIIENEQDMRVMARDEIIRCKDCKFYTPLNRETKSGICSLLIHQNFGDDWYCAGAERRTDG